MEVKEPRVRSGGIEVAQPQDDDLASRLRVAVTRLNRRMRQQSLAGLSPAQAQALGSVNRLGRPTLGELAVAEQVQPPTMTRLVAGMEERGLLRRLGDEADRRVFRVELTAEGRRVLERIRSLKDAYLSRQLTGLDPARRDEAVRLVTLLEALAAEQ
jgi:DNA-binding MarR family transcriptional regulator